MSTLLIQEYYTRLEKIIQHGGTRNETAIRSAFYILLNSYCESRNFELVTEIGQKGSKKRPDGTIKDALRLEWGYWESKDEYDDLDAEIKAKFDRGYPRDNILFEDSRRAVLFQNGNITDISMQDAEKLNEIINCLLSYERPEIRTFREAIEQFKTDLPTVLNTLREKIAEESLRNFQFQNARDIFLKLCKDAINPQITPEDVREMMIQHILTEEIFLSVFNESRFHRENNIAHELEKVVNTFFTGQIRRNILENIENYYLVIKRHAGNIANHHEKQKFLKVLYENFYRIYNPKAADRLGIFYTPNEIVHFMIESTDYLLDKCFRKLLSDPGVHILDPATGTGTFITELIEYLPKKYLPHKYREEIHCNEVSILPYYIANLNIEFTYKQKMGQYAEFKHICFMDTLDHSRFSQKQSDLYSMTVENTDRINRQNNHEIFVIIGNPPYNANQQNENENNKNREYEEVDKRIRATYIKESTAQKTKLYDMYARFFRWATDRIGDKEGIVAFITNSSFIDARTFDGFRKVVSEEFDEIHIVDLGGNVRKKEKSNVFGIKLGVAVSFMIKYRNRRDSVQEKLKRKLDEFPQCRIYYYHVPEFDTAREKLNFMATAKFANIEFKQITPDENHNWINLTDNDFDQLLPLANKETKLGKDETALFKFFSLGVVTNRDDWVYDFNERKLIEKVNFFCETYKKEKMRWQQSDKNMATNDFVDRKIKWTSELETHLCRGSELKFEKNFLATSFYRPFVKKKLYYAWIIIHRMYQMPSIFPVNDKCKNLLISITDPGSEKSFMCLASDEIVDLHFTSPGSGSQCFPFYRYENGSRIDNITDWGLLQFTTHYKKRKISRENIFHYVYAVLHNPAYRKTYEQNLKRELPRIPFYADFDQWVEWGKELMDLHIRFETADPYPLERTEIPDKSPKPKLKIDKETGAIIIDTATSLHGIPETAWEYKLGTYCALQWILDQYREKKIKDPAVAEKFDTYRFADYKEKVIDLLQRICTVSVRTMEIVNEMEKLS